MPELGSVITVVAVSVAIDALRINPYHGPEKKI